MTAAAVDASRPEALIYEASEGALQLVGVEFVVFADASLAQHDSPPVLEGQSFQFISSPNRYGLPALMPTAALAVAIDYAFASSNSSELSGGRRPSVLSAK
jgi:hypothetical protein